jgi:hypothetical protein
MPTSRGFQYKGLARHHSGRNKYENATYAGTVSLRIRKLSKTEIREWVERMRDIENKRNGNKLKRSDLLMRRAIV